MDTSRIHLISLITVIAAIACCQTRRDEAACRQICPSFGIENAAKCSELCTTPCQELARTYGISQERCQEIQAGELEPVPERVDPTRADGAEPAQ